MSLEDKVDFIPKTHDKGEVWRASDSMAPPQQQNVNLLLLSCHKWYQSKAKLFIPKTHYKGRVWIVSDSMAPLKHQNVNL